MPPSGTLGEAPAIRAVEPKLNLDEMARRRRTRTKRGSEAYKTRLRRRRQLRRQNKRALNQFKKVLPSLNCEERVPVGPRSDPSATQTRIKKRNEINQNQQNNNNKHNKNTSTASKISVPTHH